MGVSFLSPSPLFYVVFKGFLCSTNFDLFPLALARARGKAFSNIFMLFYVICKVTLCSTFFVTVTVLSFNVRFRLNRTNLDLVSLDLARCFPNVSQIFPKYFQTVSCCFMFFMYILCSTVRCFMFFKYVLCSTVHVLCFSSMFCVQQFDEVRFEITSSFDEVGSWLSGTSTA